MPSRLEVVHDNNILRLARAHLELKQAMAACDVSGRVVAKEVAAARKAALANAKKRAASKPGGKPKAGAAVVTGVQSICGPRACVSLIYVHIVFHICALVVGVLTTDCMDA